MAALTLALHHHQYSKVVADDHNDVALDHDDVAGDPDAASADHDESVGNHDDDSDDHIAAAVEEVSC